MKNYVSKIICLLSAGVLLGACNNSGGSKAKEQYFKYVAEALEDPEPEEIYATFYDAKENRFYMELCYDQHSGLALKVVEYDLWDFIFYPNQGEISEDYESISLTYSAYEESDLFARGTYVLSHSLKNGKDTFALDAAGTSYSLTLSKKENPHYIDKDLVGEFEYQSEGNVLFSMSVDVGEKSDGYPVSISLEEQDLSFTTSNIENSDVTTTFNIKGTEDGTYVKRVNDASFTYNEGYELYQLTIGEETYSLTKTRGYDDEDEETNYFFLNAGLVKFTCDDFEARLTTSGGDMVQLIFKELVEQGNPNFWCWFKKGEDDSITNAQSITNPNNKVFVNVTTYSFKHRVENEADVVDLYFDGVLTYPNLTIVEVKE